MQHGALTACDIIQKTEVPDVNTIVLVEKEDGSIWQYKVFAKSQMLGWKRWAYIKDLIPNE